MAIRNYEVFPYLSSQNSDNSENSRFSLLSEFSQLVRILHTCYCTKLSLLYEFSPLSEFLVLGLVLNNAIYRIYYGMNVHSVQRHKTPITRSIPATLIFLMMIFKYAVRVQLMFV